MEFGRFAAERRKRRGTRRPEAFDFLGFTHYCSMNKKGRFFVMRKTHSARMMGQEEDQNEIRKPTLKSLEGSGRDCAAFLFY